MPIYNNWWNTGWYIYFTAIANAPSVIAHKRNSEKILFEEDNYEDNCIDLNIKIKGNEDRDPVRNDEYLYVRCGSNTIYFVLKITLSSFT